MNSENHLNFLVKASRKLSSLTEEDAVFRYTTDTLIRMIDGGVTVINTFDKEAGHLECRYVKGLGGMSGKVLSILKQRVVGMQFPMNDEAYSALIESRLITIEGGLHTLALGSLPKKISLMIERLLKLRSFYSLGIVERNELLGIITLMAPRPLQNPSLVEAFIQQAAPTFLRIRATHALVKTNEQLQSSNQELLTAERQLREKNKQLKAKNQQFEATNQQFEAANQQLEATNQQLEATNQQLETRNLELQESRKQIEENQKLYETVVENIREALIIHDGSRILFANQAATKYADAPALEGQDLFGLIAPEYKEMVSENNRKRLSGEKVPEIYDAEIMTKDGKIVPMEFSVAVISYKAEKAFLVMLHDLSEREKATLQKQLLQSQKMEAIATLAGGIAHDLNNLLTVIKGHAQLTLMNHVEIVELREDMEQILESANRGADLTRQLLLYSRRQPMNYEQLNINDRVKKLMKLLGRLIGEDVKVTIKLSTKLWDVKADSGNIDQVIMNLTVNARDAMPQGGELIFKTHNVRIDESYRRAYTYAKVGDYVCLEIEDTGTGMDEGTAARVFEPFFTTKSTGKGTGLGLSVVYGIVKEHDGWINIYSEPGQGSVFKIYLPASFDKKKPKIQSFVREKIASGKGEKILLVEDEESVLSSTKTLLEKSGYKITVATNAEEALEIFRKKEGDFDLVFTDTILPGKTGLELIKDIHTINPHLRVLVCSGYTGERIQRETIERRNYPFIQKPFDLDQLLSKIKEVMNRES